MVTQHKTNFLKTSCWENTLIHEVHEVTIVLFFVQQLFEYIEDNDVNRDDEEEGCNVIDWSGRRWMAYTPDKQTSKLLD